MKRDNWYRFWDNCSGFIVIILICLVVDYFVLPILGILHFWIMPVVFVVYILALGSIWGYKKFKLKSSEKEKKEKE